MNNLTVERIIKMLDLVPLRPEGGFFRQTWKTSDGTSIYYLIDGDSFSSLHKLDFAEIWHFYAGDPVKQLQLLPDGSAVVRRMSGTLQDGYSPQLISPENCWQATRLEQGGKWALLGTTMAPPYTDDCIHYPDMDEIFRNYPDHTGIIREFL